MRLPARARRAEHPARPPQRLLERVPLLARHVGGDPRQEAPRRVRQAVRDGAARQVRAQRGGNQQGDAVQRVAVLPGDAAEPDDEEAHYVRRAVRHHLDFQPDRLDQPDGHGAQPGRRGGADLVQGDGGDVRLLRDRGVPEQAELQRVFFFFFFNDVAVVGRGEPHSLSLPRLLACSHTSSSSFQPLFVSFQASDDVLLPDLHASCGNELLRRW